MYAVYTFRHPHGYHVVLSDTNLVILCVGSLACGVHLRVPCASGNGAEDLYKQVASMVMPASERNVTNARNSEVLDNSTGNSTTESRGHSVTREE